ncbi:MAG TPA: alpha/beta-hydrolase family protein [Micromonosporaceae bacterium]
MTGTGMPTGQPTRERRATVGKDWARVRGRWDTTLERRGQWIRRQWTGVPRRWSGFTHESAATLRRVWSWSRLSFCGSLLAVGFVCLSLTPSLLPRTWQVQGFISGFSGSVGYATGVTAAWFWTKVNRGRVSVSAHLASVLRRGLAVLAALLLAVSLFLGSRWQRELYLLMGERPPGRAVYLGVLAITGLLVAALIAVVRGIRAAARVTVRLLRHWIPPVPAQLAGVAAVGLLTIALLDSVVHDGFLSVASSTSAAINDSIGSSATPPAQATRSGSPHSLARWDTLGLQGRSFVTGGPTLAQLRQFGGPGAKEPIRVYVGLKSAPSTSAAADLAVRELERTGAFSRTVLCVVTTTGTGWIDPYLAAALEYLHQGDTAIVGTQYSYLPSWISFLTDRDLAEQAGRALFDQVYARWSTLPPQHRPKLIVFGESLGSFGSEAAFGDLADIRARTDGVLWAGPTNANRLWNEFLANREPGTSEVHPIYQQGETVRFVSQPSDLDQPASAWPRPRVVYLQNPSDPVTWWSPELVLTRPGWLEEPRGYDVLPAMRWYPFVTFFQVTADLALAERAPVEHGHRFHRAAVAAWAAIVPPAHWDPARTAALTQLLDRQFGHA